MSQFMLVISAQAHINDVSAIRVCRINEAEDFLKNAAKELISVDDMKLCWYPEDEIDQCTEKLFTEAQRDIADKVDFSSTRLGKLLFELLGLSREIILWYGNDWSDLPCTRDKKEFIASVKSQLTEDVGEVYLKFSSL